MNNDASNHPAYEEIARRAHQIWEENGRPEGQEQEHWFQAERELAEKTSAKPVHVSTGGSGKMGLEDAGSPAAATKPPRASTRKRRS